MNERVFIVNTSSAAGNIGDGEVRLFTTMEVALQYAELVDGQIIIKDLETELDLSEWN
jgi:hypothetical protein